MDRLSKACVGTMLLVMLLAVVLTTGALAEGAIEVVVSPNVLNLNSNGGRVSLHTDIDFDVVDSAKLYVSAEDGLSEEISISRIFADTLGDLVVKCDIDIVKGMVVAGDATFVLEVDTDDGTYSGTDTIAVIDRGK